MGREIRKFLFLAGEKLRDKERDFEDEGFLDKMKWILMKETNFSNWKINFQTIFMEWKYFLSYSENFMVAFCFIMALGPLFKGLTLHNKRLLWIRIVIF